MFTPSSPYYFINQRMNFLKNYIVSPYEGMAFTGYKVKVEDEEVSKIGVATIQKLNATFLELALGNINLQLVVEDSDLQVIRQDQEIRNSLSPDEIKAIRDGCLAVNAFGLGSVIGSRWKVERDSSSDKKQESDFKEEGSVAVQPGEKPKAEAEKKQDAASS